MAQGSVVELRVPQSPKTIKTGMQLEKFIDKLFPGCQLEVDNDGQLIIYTGLDNMPHQSKPDKNLLAEYVFTEYDEDGEEDEEEYDD